MVRSPALLFALLCLPAAAAADGVILRGGGEVRGDVETRGERGRVTVRTPSGVSIGVSRDDVRAVRRRPPIVEEYITRSRTIPDTAAAHAALAEWCERNLLPDERLEQYEQVARLDPANEDANRALGRVLIDGQWLSKDQALAQDGRVQVDGQWVSEAEAAFLKEHENDEADRKIWFGVVREIERRLEFGEPAERLAALEELRDIDDPLAIDALVKRLGSVPNVDLRLEVVEALGRMGVYPAVRPLVRFAVFDAEPAVRQRALDGFPAELHLTAADEFVKLLRNRDNGVVQRAAAGLAAVGTREAVPALIHALVTSHQTTVRVLNDAPNYQVGGGMTRGAISPEAYRQIAEASFPFGANVIHPDSAYRTKTIRVAVQNEAARLALINITGEDFGYNEAAWRRWWRQSGKAAG